MSEYYSLINWQNSTFVDLIPISQNTSAVLNRGVNKINKTASI